MVRNQQVNIKLTLNERHALEILAARESRKISECARELIRQAIEQKCKQSIGLVDLLYGKVDHGK